MHTLTGHQDSIRHIVQTAPSLDRATREKIALVLAASAPLSFSPAQDEVIRSDALKQLGYANDILFDMMREYESSREDLISTYIDEANALLEMTPFALNYASKDFWVSRKNFIQRQNNLPAGRRACDIPSHGEIFSIYRGLSEIGGDTTFIVTHIRNLERFMDMSLIGESYFDLSDISLV